MTDPTHPDAQPGGEPNGLGFPLVGVGASAGGLEAVTQLLEGLPADPGLSLVLIMHLDRHHKTSLPEILGRVTRLPVRMAAEGMPLEVNHLYIGPGDASVLVGDGRLRLDPRPPRGAYSPIDHLFRSLAQAQKTRSIGVVLSGEGTDGALGLQAIKAEGGITFAQDAGSARHASMPRSAIVEGVVDYILPPDEVARELLRIARHTYTSAAPTPEKSPDAVEPILTLVRAQTDVDFTHYKRTTLQRRIHRRMALRGLERVEDYLWLLRDDPAELQALYHDFLIRVTQFFRDPDSFEALKQKVFPALVEKRPPGSAIRLWAAGCSTGEEVYSLVICLLEFLDGRTDSYPVKILATDLSEASLAKARSGLYLDNIEIDVSPERLRRFFARTDGHYQISKAVREQCVFSRHNVARDPPFSRLDLISCRNVLIYMDAALQRRVLPVLHYALNPAGYLFLGGSENVGPFGELFVPVDQRHRIFAKSQSGAGLPPGFSLAAAEGGGRAHPVERPAAIWSAVDVQREADRIVLARYAPVGVVVDEAMTVLQFRGRTSAYLEPAPGVASLDLLRMLREGLLAEVRAAVNQAKGENAAATREVVRRAEDGALRPLRVEVIPFKVPPSGTRFFLVLFQDAPSAVGPGQAEEASAPPAPAAPAPAEQQAAQLQQELAALRAYLQSVIEEQESTNEELKSANEEILSTNEELQSTNEELQTAKEEAQSANEELVTVNEELRHRNVELARVNDDLVNLLAGVSMPIVMVGRDLRIRRFTPLAEKVFNLIPTDLGRPISDIKSNLQRTDLAELIARVIDTLAPHEGGAVDRDGRRYSLRIRPFITQENKIDGASVVLLDVESLRAALQPSASPSPEVGQEGPPAP